jgi:hypothetical protein
MIGAILALVLVVAAGAAIVVLVGGYKPDQATYSKTVFTPKEVEVAMVEASFTPIPKAEPAAAEEETKTTRRSTRRSRSSSSRTRSSSASKSKRDKPKQNDANKRAKELENMLNSSDDIFGGK